MPKTGPKRGHLGQRWAPRRVRLAQDAAHDGARRASRRGKLAPRSLAHCCFFLCKIIIFFEKASQEGQTTQDGSKMGPRLLKREATIVKGGPQEGPPWPKAGPKTG